jgi:prevent-host-death family protein
MTKSVGVHEAKTHLSRLLERVAAGERVEITRRGVVVAHLVPPPEPSTPRFGYARGSVTIADDFDAPLPEEILAEFS